MLVINKNNIKMPSWIADRMWILWITIAVVLLLSAIICILLMADVTLLSILKIGILTKLLGVPMGLWLVVQAIGIALIVRNKHKKNGLDDFGKAMLAVTILIALQPFIYSLCLTFGINRGWATHEIFNLYLFAMPVAIIFIGLLGESFLSGPSRKTILLAYIIMSVSLFCVNRYDQSRKPQVFNPRTGVSNVWQDPISKEIFFKPNFEWHDKTGGKLIHITDRRKAQELVEEMEKKRAAKVIKKAVRNNPLVKNENPSTTGLSIVDNEPYAPDTEIPIKKYGDFTAIAKKNGSPTFVIKVSGPFRYHFRSPYTLGVEFEGGPIQVFYPDTKQEYVNPNRRVVLYHKGPGNEQQVTVSILQTDS